MNAFNAVTRMVTLGVLIAIAGSVAAQQAYPNKPIRLTTPYAPGGSTTILARMIGQKLTESWGQQVIVENRPGGNLVIGTESLAKSAPDGYTIMLTSSAHVINPNLIPNLPYDPVKDFAPIGTVSRVEYVLVVHPSVPANTLREFIDLAKARPGQLNYATPGSGGPGHLATEMFSMMTGVKMQHVPYKGGGAALIDLVGGQVQLCFATPLEFTPHIKSGKLRALAVSGPARLPSLADVPTFTEAGLPGLDIAFWQGILAPAGTPKAIIDKISTELGRILALPETREKLVFQGMAPFINTPAQFSALIKADMVKFAKLIKQANIKMEN